MACEDHEPLDPYCPEDETQHAIFVRPLCEWTPRFCLLTGSVVTGELDRRILLETDPLGEG